jgi:hypothetical protein
MSNCGSHHHYLLFLKGTGMKRMNGMGAKRLGVVLAILLGALIVALAGSQAIAAVPHSSTGVVTSCYDSTGALRVVDTERGGACATGETPLTWNATTVSATQWSSAAIKQMNPNPGVLDLAMLQPGNKLPAGSWILTASVLIANGAGVDGFHCLMRTATTAVTIASQDQEWGGAGDWHRTITFPGLATLAAPDWVDVYCSHDRKPPPGSVLQIANVHVIAQRVAATF